MDAANVKSLWGESFRIVEHGLAEVDVIKFVERLLTKQRIAEQRMAHLSSLNELAAKTVESAERLAWEVQEEAEREALKRSAATIAQAEEQAQAIIQDAIARATAVEAEAAHAVSARVRDMEGTLASMAQWPEEELYAIVELQQRIQSFRGVFEGLVGLLKTPLLKAEDPKSFPLEESNPPSRQPA